MRGKQLEFDVIAQVPSPQLNFDGDSEFFVSLPAGASWTVDTFEVGASGGDVSYACILCFHTYETTSLRPTYILMYVLTTYRAIHGG